MNDLLIDTHAHLTETDFDEDRPETIHRAMDAGIGTIITIGTDLESSKKALELSEQYPGICATVGFQPHDAAAVETKDIKKLEEIAEHPNVVAIGETGLDFYRDYSPRESQIQSLKWQLSLSEKLKLPVIIHCRQAEEDMLHLLRSWLSVSKETNRENRGVIHCFMGDKNTAREYLDMGFYLSFGAYIGYPSSKDLHDIVRSIPGDRLLLETDSPFLPPQQYRGKRNEPSYIIFTAKALSEIRQESYDTIALQTTRNARRLFCLPMNPKR